MHCTGVTSDNGPAVNGPAVTSRNCVLDPRKNETLDVVTSKSDAAELCGVHVRETAIAGISFRQLGIVRLKFHCQSYFWEPSGTESF